MLRIINNLFPSFSIELSNTTFQNHHLINITIDDDYYFIELSEDNLSHDTMEFLLIDIQNFFETLLPTKKTIQTHTISSVQPDNVPKVSFVASYKDGNKFSISLPLDTLIYISNEYQLTNFFKTSSLLDFHLELFRFKPNFIEPNYWHLLPEKELRDIFYFMITKNLATPQMFALFFKKIKMNSFENYFSTNIANSIQQEFQLLYEDESSLLLDCIYYIIENNLRLYLKNSTILPEKRQLLYYYHEYFIHGALAKIDLNKYPLIVNLSKSSNYPSILNKIPRKNIVSFLRYSQPKNHAIIQQAFSKDGWDLIQQDAKSPNIPAQDSTDFFYFIARILAYNSSFEDLADRFLTKDRDWEFLARECDLHHLLLCLDEYKKHRKLSGIIKQIHTAYEKKIIVLPQIKKYTFIESQQIICAHIYYLHLIGYLS